MARTGVVLGMLLLVGCAEAPHTMYILGNKVPDADCTISPGAEGVYASIGILDLEDQSQPFIFTPVIQSDAVANESPMSRIIQLKGADIHYLSTDGSEFGVNPTTTFFSGTVQPGGTAAVSFVVVAPNLFQDVNLNGTVILASVSVFGEIDGNEIRSPTFEYPISVCIGCIDAPLDDELMELGTCFGDQLPNATIE